MIAENVLPIEPVELLRPAEIFNEDNLQPNFDENLEAAQPVGA